MSKTGTTRHHTEPGPPLPEGRTDWERVRVMTDGEVIEAALSDPDAQPMTPEELSRMRRLPDVKALRARLGMTQKQFAFNYRSAPRAIGCRDEPGRMPRH